jgi:hypothetical protein
MNVSHDVFVTKGLRLSAWTQRVCKAVFAFILGSSLLFGGCSKKKADQAESGKDKAKKTRDGATLYKSAITEKKQKKKYTIKAKKGQLIALALTNAPATKSPVDYTMELLDPEQKRVIRVRDTNGSDGTTELKTRVYAATAGDYELQVYDWDGNDVDPKGSFEVTVKLLADPDRYEPNHGPNLDSNKALAKELKKGAPLTAFIEFQGDEDWFKFKGKKNTVVEIKLTNAPATSSAVDYTVSLFNDTDKNRMWRIRDTNGSDGTTVLETRRYIPSDGTYYVRVYDWDGDEYETDGRYELTLKEIAEPDKNEPNNAGNIDSSRSAATVIESGKTIEGMVEYEGDEDWYKISAEKGKLLKIGLTNAPATASPVDYTLAMFDSTDKKRMWRIRDTNGSDGTTTLETIAYVPAKGDFYLRVHDWDGNEYEKKGAYKLTVTMVDDPDTFEPNNGGNFDASKVMAKPLAKAKSVQGIIEYRADEDWFVVDHKGGELVVELSNAPQTTSTVDFTVALYDAKGKRIERVHDSNGADGTTKLTLKKKVDSGKYYVRITDWDGDDFGLDQVYALSYGGKTKPVKVPKTARAGEATAAPEKTAEAEGKAAKKNKSAKK